MPGIVFCKRRCRFGSDDLLLPGLSLLVIHIAWVFIFVTILNTLAFHTDSRWLVTLQEYIIGLISIYGGCVIIEGAITAISIRGTVLNVKPRASMTYLLYIRLAVLLTEVGWQVYGVTWIIVISTKSDVLVQGFIIGSVLSDWLVIMVVISAVSLSDVSLSETNMAANHVSADAVTCDQETSGNQLCDGSQSESTAGKSVVKPVQHHTIHHSACCFKKNAKSNSFAEIAGVLSVFLRDLDLVPTDIIVGLILMHRRQKLHQRLVISESSTEVYQFLSGAAITSSTRFLSLKTPESLQMYERVVHFMRYPMVAYECQRHPTSYERQKATDSRPSRCSSSCCDEDSYRPRSVLVEDSGCRCINGDLSRLRALTQFDLVYISYHSECDVDIIPFFVGLDHAQKSIVVCLWNRLCLMDVFSDFSPEVDSIPATEPEPLVVNKGFLRMATFVYNKLKKDKLLVQALNFDLELGTSSYELVIVGHSLAAGVAAILSVILRAEFPSVRCYAYSPPSGIVKETCVEDTKSFVTSVVVGKDLVPRIGVSQTDAFRRRLLEALSGCNRSKWRIICGATCCRCLANPRNPKDLGLAMQSVEGLFQQQAAFDQQQSPMSIPGRIIHIIRSHPKPASRGSMCATEGPVFQAIWAESCDFNEILVSPTMISDHSPYVVYDALQKVLTHVSPTKPSRKPMKQRGCSMTPNSSSNICDPPHSSEFHLQRSDPEPEVTGRAVTALTLSQPISCRKMASPTDVVEFFAAATTKDRPRNFSALPRQHLIDVRRDDLSGSAPLASPEILSETSSLASFGSGGGSVRQAGYQRLMSGAGKMDPIKQSPLSHSVHHTRGYSLILEPVQSKEEKVFANCVVLNPSGGSHRLLTRSSNELYRKTPDLDVRNPPKDDMKICAVAITRSSVDETLPIDSLGKNFSTSADSVRARQHTEIEIHQHKANSLDEFFETAEEPTRILNAEDVGEPVLTADAQESSQENSEIGYNSLPCKVHVSNDSDRDSVESGFGRHYLYDGYVGHYSPAGRGYPHGFHDECYRYVSLTNQRADVGSGFQLVNNDCGICPSGDVCGRYKV